MTKYFPLQLYRKTNMTSLYVANKSISLEQTWSITYLMSKVMIQLKNILGSGEEAI